MCLKGPKRTLGTLHAPLKQVNDHQKNTNNNNATAQSNLILVLKLFFSTLQLFAHHRLPKQFLRNFFPSGLSGLFTLHQLALLEVAFLPTVL